MCGGVAPLRTRLVTLDFDVVDEGKVGVVVIVRYAAVFLERCLWSLRQPRWTNPVRFQQRGLRTYCDDFICSHVGITTLLRCQKCQNGKIKK